MAVTRVEIKKIKSLSSRKGRREHGLYAAEGVRLLEEAIRYKSRPKTVYWSEAMVTDRGLKLIADFQHLDIRTKKVKPEQMQLMADTKSPQGVLAVFPVPGQAMTKLWGQGPRKILLCENLSDPGNLGTLARSALAFGFGGMIMTGASVEPFSPKVLRASMGAIFALRLGRIEEKDLVPALKNDRYKLIAADIGGKPEKQLPIRSLRNQKLILALGSEASGLSVPLIKAADFRVRLSHRRDVESLNVAIAGSILMKMFYDKN